MVYASTPAPRRRQWPFRRPAFLALFFIALLFAVVGPSTALEAVSGSLPLELRSKRRCKIYVMDPSVDLAAAAGVPVCNASDVEFWPHNEPGKGIQSMPRTPHWAHQHGGGYALANAIRSSSHHVDSFKGATIIFLDMHCYHSWFVSYLRQRKPIDGPGSPKEALVTLLAELLRRPEVAEDEGARLAMYLPIPGTIGVYSKALSHELKKSKVLLLEAGFLGGDVRRSKIADGSALILPYSSLEDVSVEEPVVYEGRDTFLFLRAGCSETLKRSAGILMRHRAIEIIRETASAHNEVGCTCSTCPGHVAHDEVQRHMRRSRFCLVLAGDTQASVRLTEVVLAGCLPVFVGPPWHTMPLPKLVDWRSFGTFLEVEDTSSFVISDPITNKTNLVSWTVNPEADIHDVTIKIPTLGDIEGALAAIPEREVAEKFENLKRALPYFYYGPMPATGRSVLGDSVIEHFCSLPQLTPIS